MDLILAEAKGTCAYCHCLLLTDDRDKKSPDYYIIVNKKNPFEDYEASCDHIAICMKCDVNRCRVIPHQIMLRHGHTLKYRPTDIVLDTDYTIAYAKIDVDNAN